jgi:acid phosphatase (class A)
MKLPSALWLLPALVLSVSSPPCARAADATAPAGHFVDPASFDLRKILPEPPAPGTLAGLADLEAVRGMQAVRTAADVAWARRIADFTAFDYADVLGPWFNAKNLPITAEFLREITEDSEATSDRVKLIYSRPRPPVADPQIQPCVKVPKTTSYPSGHATRAFLWAAVLSDLFPDQREALLDWAHRAAWGRIVGGAHYPTDVVGGQFMARALLEALQKSPAFHAALEQARAEVAPYTVKKAA